MANVEGQWPKRGSCSRYHWNRTGVSQYFLALELPGAGEFQIAWNPRVGLLPVSPTAPSVLLNCYCYLSMLTTDLETSLLIPMTLKVLS